MKKENLEILNAVYNGISIYKRLTKTIVEIEGKFVSLEDKRELALYLGLLHTPNNISNMLNNTELKNNTKVDYTKVDINEYNELYNKYFRYILENINLETIEEYFNYLLSKEIIKNLNKEYNFNPLEFVSNGNKQLVKK